MMTWGERYWPVFLIISSLWMLCGFGIPEGIALGTHPSTHLDNTLSYYARTQLHSTVSVAGTVHTWVWWVTFIAWLMFVVFITAHIWMDQFG